MIIGSPFVVGLVDFWGVFGGKLRPNTRSKKGGAGSAGTRSARVLTRTAGCLGTYETFSIYWINLCFT